MLRAGLIKIFQDCQVILKESTLKGPVMSYELQEPRATYPRATSGLAAPTNITGQVTSYELQQLRATYPRVTSSLAAHTTLTSHETSYELQEPRATNHELREPSHGLVQAPNQAGDSEPHHTSHKLQATSCRSHEPLVMSCESRAPAWARHPTTQGIQTPTLLATSWTGYRLPHGLRAVSQRVDYKLPNWRRAGSQRAVYKPPH